MSVRVFEHQGKRYKVDSSVIETGDGPERRADFYDEDGEEVFSIQECGSIGFLINEFKLYIDGEQLETSEE